VSSIEHAADVLPIRGRVGDGLVDGLHRVASAFGSTEGAERANAEAKRACELVAALGSGRLTPTTAISELVARWAPDVRVTVDAGAHMLPAMQLWPAEARGDLLISNGLATMGFALPAAIGAALLESGRRVVALTGDGGLLMCLGELATLARENLDVCVVVFDDRTLSLIKLKQEQRGEAAGVALGPVDWVTMASSLGIRGYAADSMEGLRARIADIGSKPGPSLLAIRVESFDYVPVLQAIRG
jgi:acetolactate synthase-1/2/3 large subunit